MAPRNPIGRTFRQARRSREILSVLIRYGFEDVVIELGLDRVIERGRRLFGQRPREEYKRLPQPVRLRQALEELGATFIKLGQVLSMRPDLIPPEWASEFRRLQDEAPEVPFERIRERLEAEFPSGVDALFPYIEREPIAAASLAQIHRARRPDGTEVVLKVLRPEIHEVLESDMDILRWLAGFAENHFSNLGYSPTEVVEQFARELEREIDLAREGRSAERLGNAFADNPNVLFPTVHHELTTANCLCMEEVHGTPLSRFEEGGFTAEERRAVVANGTDAVFRQCLVIGFFHADPHPGNIFALPGGRVCFIDCGMTGQIDPATAGRLADLVWAVLAGDLDRVIEVTLALSDADPAIAEDRTFRADAWEFISRFHGATFQTLDMGRLLQDFFDRIRRHGLRCPADMVFLIKALTTIEGVGEQLLPSFDVVGYVRPYVEDLVWRRYSFSAVRKRLRRTAVGYAELAEDMPGQLRSLFYALRRNRMTVNLEHRGLDQVTRTLEHASLNVARALIIAGLLIGSSVLMLADATTGTRGVFSIVGFTGFGVAGLLALWYLVLRAIR